MDVSSRSARRVGRGKEESGERKVSCGGDRSGRKGRRMQLASALDERTQTLVGY